MRPWQPRCPGSRAAPAPDPLLHVPARAQFTLDTNRGAIQLASLFGDLFDQPGVTEDTVARVASVGGNVLSFTYFNGEDCTVLASKSGGRYRMQGSALEALWLVSSELVRRMHNLAGSAVAEGGPAFAVTFQEPLPLADFFACIDAHFAVRAAGGGVRVARRVRPY